MGLFNNMLDKSPETMIKQAKNGIIYCVITSIVCLIIMPSGDGFLASIGKFFIYCLLIPSVLGIVLNIGRYFENKKKIEEVNKIKDEFKELSLEIKYCPNCGIKNESDARFCEKCGTQFN